MEMTLSWVPTWMVKDGVWAVVGPLQGQDDAAAVHPDVGGTQKVNQELLKELAAQVVFARQRKSRSI